MVLTPRAQTRPTRARPRGSDSEHLEGEEKINMGWKRAIFHYVMEKIQGEEGGSEKRRDREAVRWER